MPKVPKWMANAMERLFCGMYHPVRVTQIEQLDAQLRKVRFEGDFSKTKQFTAGNMIEFRVSDTEFRHYSPARFLQERGICEVVFYLHGRGVGSKWAAGLQVGQELNLLGPGGKTNFVGEAKCHVVCGDETSLGVMKNISDRAERENKPCLCLAELETGHSHWPKLLGFDCVSLPKHSVSEPEVIEKVKEFTKTWGQDKREVAFYLSGRAKSITQLKKQLLNQNYHSKSIQTEPFWAEGKVGL